MKENKTSTERGNTMKEFIELLGVATNNHYNIGNLTGKHNADIRQRLIQVLTGNKITKAKSGINVLIDTAYKAFNVSGTCMADMEKNFINKCKEV